ncbi:MAG: DJ-1 family protein [Crocinitomicaceae bacterium]|nr:DJ-1 family protein [Crocinitomicaceae bacterium]|tara:strand:- start:2794 stop:3369 length:576 start_codon:yes stop_codon:yes gene_type:complete
MKKILLLLADGFEILESSAFIDVMGWNLEEGNGSTQLFSCGLKKEIKSSFNQNFTVDFLIKDIEVGSYDALAIPGGFESYGYYKDAYNEKFLSIIREFNQENKIIASVCVGALPVAKSGILIDKNATTYNSELRRNKLKEFGVNVLNKNIIVDGKIITSKGPSTAIEVAFLLLEKLSSIDNAKKVKKLMGY